MSIFDILTVLIFAGLMVLFLRRSTSEGPYPDHLWQYLVASIGCAVANYLGDHGYPVIAVALICGTLYYVQRVLRPFSGLPPK